MLLMGYHFAQAPTNDVPYERIPPVKTRILTTVCVLALAATGLATGCAKKAPQLTPQQLAAGIIPAEHPVSQADATAQGCACYLQQ